MSVIKWFRKLAGFIVAFIGYPQTVIDEVSKTEDVVTYEQFVGENNLVLKQGKISVFFTY